MTVLETQTDLASALAVVAAEADALDRAPAFPVAAFRALAAAGGLAPPPTFGEELALVRAVAGADGSAGRIIDGHLNAVERVALLAPELCDDRLLGVWGADPGPGEGEPARLLDGRVRGTKTFCSGAGGLDAALVVVREGEARRLVYLDLGEGVEIDREWFHGSGLRAAESHRVTFRDVPVRAVLGGPDELAREPWFGRDAVRTAASWAGIADGAHAAARAHLAAADDLAALAAARMAVEAETIDRWLAEAGERDRTIDAPWSVLLRAAVAGAATRLLDEAVRAAGARALVGGGPLDRAARDLRLFLGQKRLDPLLVRAGRASLAL
jgi:alkylation response protein AidB-like acyl-CoA dehydrogenase